MVVMEEDRKGEISAHEAGAEAPSGLALKGRVQDVSGSPVGDADVSFEPLDLTTRNYGSAGAPATRSDASGSFTFHWSGDFGRIVAESEAYATVMPFELFTTPVDVIVVVVGQRASYAGWVKSDRGVPLHQALITITMDPAAELSILPGKARSHSRTWTVESSEDGGFAIEDVGWTSGLQISVELFGYQKLTRALQPYSEGGMLLVLQPVSDTASVCGTVIDRDQQPIAGVTVCLGAETTTTDRSGRFALRRDDPSRPQTLLALGRGYLPKELDLGPSSQFRGSIVLVLDEPTLSIGGKVVMLNERPVANARVWIGDPTTLESALKMGAGQLLATGPTSVEDAISGEQRGSYKLLVRSKVDGRFEFRGLLPRSYAVAAMDPDSMCVTVVPSVAAGTSDLRIVLNESGTLRRVAGRVVSRHGVPLEGVRVTLQRAVAIRGQRSHTPVVVEGCPATDAGGRFAFGPICVDGTCLTFCGSGVCFDQRVELGDVSDVEHMEIQVGATCAFQVDLCAPDDADTFLVTDVSGKFLEVSHVVGGDMHISCVVDLIAGHTEVCSVCEDAAFLVLMKGGLRVRKVPITLAVGRMTTLYP